MVDRVYKGSLPGFRAQLEELRAGFAELASPTDWTTLRIEPLLRHVDSLQRLTDSADHAREFSRLTKGVAMFHSDLVYLRLNVQELARTLRAEQNRPANRRPLPAPPRRRRT
ncbi:MAG TPA: hypothetical protein VGP88_06470 [Thermoplasmata archaeon]|jgi:hypothetical protein|nr:hypothetical protein [Thermoplasmata archaeon]